jgi:hypothetical protein
MEVSAQPPIMFDNLDGPPPTSHPDAPSHPAVYEPPVDTSHPTAYEPPVDTSHPAPNDNRHDHNDVHDRAHNATSVTDLSEPSSDDIYLSKQTLLADLHHLENQGVKLSRSYDINDRMEDMMLEVRRATMSIEHAHNVSMMRDVMRVAVTGIEMLNNRVGLLDLDGWSTEVCRDLHKHDASLGRIYRKWWRRSTSSSPETDIALSLIGSMGMFHMKRRMSAHVMGKTPQRYAQHRAPSPASSEEDLPP